jgi:transposase
MILIPCQDRFDRMDDHTFDRKAEEVRRIEVITGVGRRRRWTTEAKARIVAESFSGDTPVSEVARRHGIRPQQLFGWRHQARASRLAPVGEGPPSFVPVIAEAGGSGMPSRPAVTGPAIEIEVRGMIVRVRGRVAAGALAEVLAAVKSVR